MLRVVAGPPDPFLDRRIARLNRGTPEVLVAPAVPGVVTALPIAATLLDALGMPMPDAGFHPRDLDLLGIWLPAHGVREVVIPHADLYPPDAIAEVSRRLDGCGASTWLLVDPGQEHAVADALSDAGAQLLPWSAFAYLFLRDVPDDAVDTIATVNPPLELPEVWQLEYDRLMEAARLSVGSNPYLIGFWAAARWRNGAGPSRAQTAQRLRELVERFDDARCRVRAVRGADVAVRVHGWEVRLDMQRFAGGPPSFVKERAATIRLADVARERDPYRAAAVALASQKLRIEELLTVRLGDVSDDGARVRLQRDVMEMPSAGCPYLLAQVHARVAAGAGPADFLFHGVPPPTVSSVTRMILATQRAIGDSFFTTSLRDRPGEDERWLNERGVWLHYRRLEEREPLRPEGMELEWFKEMLLEMLAQEPTVYRRACACSLDHPVPAEPMPAYPPERRRPPMAAHHPWRSPAFWGSHPRWSESQREARRAIAASGEAKAGTKSGF